VSARIGERQFAGAGRGAEFFKDVLLDLEIGKAPDRRQRPNGAAKPKSELLVWMRIFAENEALTGTWTMSLIG
jgi:hypothetical protein